MRKFILLLSLLGLLALSTQAADEYTLNLSPVSPPVAHGCGNGTADRVPRESLHGHSRHINPAIHNNVRQYQRTHHPKLSRLGHPGEPGIHPCGLGVESECWWYDRTHHHLRRRPGRAQLSTLPCRLPTDAQYSDTERHHYRLLHGR